MSGSYTCYFIGDLAQIVTGGLRGTAAGEALAASLDALTVAGIVGGIAGAALVIAGLMAEGTTYVENIHFVERGYQNLIEKFSALGADIRRIDEE